MIIESRELNSDSDLTIYSMEQLTVAKGQTDETVEVIHQQLKSALEGREESEVISSDWYRRCRGALRFHLSLRDRLAGRIRQLDAELRRRDQDRLERHFVEAARAMLPDELFFEILEAAQKKAL